MQKTAAVALTGISGTTASGALTYDIADPTLASITNQPSYGVDFSIAAPAAQAGYAFDDIEWSFLTKNQAGGSATNSNVGGWFPWKT